MNDRVARDLAVKATMFAAAINYYDPDFLRREIDRRTLGVTVLNTPFGRLEMRAIASAYKQ